MGCRKISPQRLRVRQRKCRGFSLRLVDEYD
jgi:hypothetical protein